MKLKDLRYDFPEDLIATEPAETSRIMWVGAAGRAKAESSVASGRPAGIQAVTAAVSTNAEISKVNAQTPNEIFEITKSELLKKFRAGDLLVVNDTRVVPRRVMVRDDFDVLFLKPLGQRRWQALFQFRKISGGSEFEMPGGVRARLIEKGRPHIVELSDDVDDVYFESYGEPPLPPYIYRARGELRARAEDLDWYQTDWASVKGSVAAPTASFHFTQTDFETLRRLGADVASITLHVGAGTFLPVTAEDLNDHIMHKEWVSISSETWRAIEETRENGGRVWVLGTTAARALESAAAGLLGPRLDRIGRFASSACSMPDETAVGSGHDVAFEGETGLLIQEGFNFNVVDVLLTNFHQPESTLLALVCAFAGHATVFEAYRWAIEKKFRLFSYGDLSVWERPVTF
jgi:S-adenosylmethionine:tRNA ribosyltransferase-isomerase